MRQNYRTHSLPSTESQTFNDVCFDSPTLRRHDANDTVEGEKKTISNRNIEASAGGTSSIAIDLHRFNRNRSPIGNIMKNWLISVTAVKAMWSGRSCHRSISDRINILPIYWGASCERAAESSWLVDAARTIRLITELLGVTTVGRPLKLTASGGRWREKKREGGHRGPQ